MKDLITAIASVLIMMIFVSQFVANLTVHNRLIQADRAIEVFRDKMKEEGYMSKENQQRLETMLKDICDCDNGEIAVQGMETPAERGELLYYHIVFPVKGMIGADILLGIDEEENQTDFCEEGFVISRREIEKELIDEEEREVNDQ